MLIDFHSHILPGIDDGADCINTSIKMLQKEKFDGIETVIATPHFYRHKEDIDSFLINRENAYNKLSEAFEKLQLPKIVLGAEVYFHHSLCEDENLEKLCIENTKYLLLEMPYQKFSTGLLDSVRNFISSSNVIPVIAHVERYLNYNNIESIYELMSMDVLGQLNCDSLTSFNTRRKAFKLLESGMIHVLGTDAHNIDSRPPLFGDAKEIIIKKKSEKTFERLALNAEKILNNTEIDNILNG